jgi:hypothetical protein
MWLGLMLKALDAIIRAQATGTLSGVSLES